MLLVTYTLIVVATVNGAASVATREFPSRVLCNEIASDLMAHQHSPPIITARCVARVVS